eukprot:TRINITY_DN8327_c0_g1_i2.p1 TRINITY_DN8327_c0_g1~~TRINITY_DN8327_c0_g1_i2.p1  ORF type:complete len:124 (-),score=24.56 TRINITY_DN8327_c0_g1_i2:262-633(-)
MVVYDTANKESFEAAQRIWMIEIEKHGAADVCKVLIGCKCDFKNERVVKEEEAAALAERYGMKFIETSAKDAVCVQEAFRVLIREICSKVGEQGGLSSQSGQKPKVTKGQQISLNENKKRKSN